ncbi:MAG: hypothetical protein IKJ56_08805 [Bacteroidales bacterium]|nr:hypothetical protein [Bacteroidales bacterium]
MNKNIFHIFVAMKGIWNILFGIAAILFLPCVVVGQNVGECQKSCDSSVAGKSQRQGGGCVSIKRETKPSNGTYCYMAPDPVCLRLYIDESKEEKFCQYSIKISSDTVCDMYFRNTFYFPRIDSCKVLMKKRMSKYLIKPTHKVNKYNYEVQKVGRRNRNSDTCTIHSFFSSYEIIDTAALYCIIDKKGDTINPWTNAKNSVIIDTTTIKQEFFLNNYSFVLKDGTIKIIPQGKCYLNLIFNNSFDIPRYSYKNILRLCKGRTYRLWFANGWEEVNFNDYIRRVNDTTIVYKTKRMKTNEMDTMYLTH